MSRCYICDYSNDDVPESIYHFGIHAPGGGRNKIVHDTIEGRDICIACKYNVHMVNKDDLRAEDAVDAYRETKELDETTV